MSREELREQAITAVAEALWGPLLDHEQIVKTYCYDARDIPPHAESCERLARAAVDAVLALLGDEPERDSGCEHDLDAPDIRLSRIAAEHALKVDEHGGNDGDCRECGWNWPCPTHRWAMDRTLTALCTWEPQDCTFEEHHHD